MGISNIGGAAAEPQMPAANKSSLNAGQAAGMAVFKKAVDLEAAQATQLIEAIQPAQSSAKSSNLPPHIGSLFQASA